MADHLLFDTSKFPTRSLVLSLPLLSISLAGLCTLLTAYFDEAASPWTFQCRHNISDVLHTYTLVAQWYCSLYVHEEQSGGSSWGFRVSGQQLQGTEEL